MRLLGPLAAECVLSALGGPQMQVHDTRLDHATTPPDRPNGNSAALLSHWQHTLFQQDAVAKPSWQQQAFWWHAALALG